MTALTRKEKLTLNQCERVIEQNLLSFYLIGVSLWTIKRDKLYRQSHSTFENYVSDRWQLKKSHAYHLVSAAKVYQNLSTIVDEKSGVPLPQNEQQIRWLSPLPANVQKIIWEKAVQVCNGEQPTGKVVKKLVDTVNDKAKQLIINSARTIRNETSRRKNEEKIQAILDKSDVADKTLGKLGNFSLLVADPPWKYDFSSSKMRDIDQNHYPTMSTEEICSLPVPEICNDDCILFLFATSPKLEDAFKVLSAWGFSYKTSMVWVKDKISTGYYARQQHENILIGTKSSCENFPLPLPENRPSSVIEIKRGRHSEKPKEIFQIIEKMYPKLSKCELFARRKRKGWKVWGNEVG